MTLLKSDLAEELIPPRYKSHRHDIPKKVS